jgi:hypothetical protein
MTTKKAEPLSAADQARLDRREQAGQAHMWYGLRLDERSLDTPRGGGLNENFQEHAEHPINSLGGIFV